MAATNVSYTPTTPAEIAAAKAAERTRMLRLRYYGSADQRVAEGLPGTVGPVSGGAGSRSPVDPNLNQDDLYKDDEEILSMWRQRALKRSEALPDDAADIALRDMETGRVTRARRGSRRESMLLGDFNAVPPMGGSSLLGG